MKKVFELIMWTLFFSTLGGFGLTAGFFGWVGAMHMLSEVWS